MSNYESRAQDVYKHLEENNIEVYFPEQHLGEVKTNYVVVRQDGENQFENYSSLVCSIDLYLYVPRNDYSQMQPFIDKVKNIMKGLEPMIKPTFYVSPSYYDDLLKGHTVTISYQYYRKI